MADALYAESLLNEDALDQALATADRDVSVFRAALQDADQRLNKGFLAGNSNPFPGNPAAPGPLIN